MTIFSSTMRGGRGFLCAESLILFHNRLTSSPAHLSKYKPGDYTYVHGSASRRTAREDAGLEHL